MRVLHITTIDKSGAGLCCLRIHQSLLNMGMESKVITLDNTQHVDEEYSYGWFYDKIASIPSKLLRLFGLTLTEKNELIRLTMEKGAAYSSPRSAVNLLNCKLIQWADIIHLHWVGNYLDYPSFFKRVNKPIVWTLHDENLFYGIAHYSESLLPDHPLEKRNAALKRDALAHAKNMVIVFLSTYMQNKFGNNDILIGKKTCVINNSIDTKRFVPINKSDARKKIGLSENSIIIAFSAYNIYDERKGLDVLYKVVLDLNNPLIKILAIGNDLGREAPENMICMGKLNTVTEICEALSAADYYVLPSYQEAFAQSPMEAMACGLPVVAFPVSGTSELINEKNGIVCDDFTQDSLRKGIEDAMRIKYDSSFIRNDVINRFSPEIIAKKYANLYLELYN